MHPGARRNRIKQKCFQLTTKRVRQSQQFQGSHGYYYCCVVVAPTTTITTTTTTTTSTTTTTRCVCCSQLHLSCSARRLHRQTLQFCCVTARRLCRERFLCDMEPAAVGVTWYAAQTAVTQCHAGRQRSTEEFASCTGCQQNVRCFIFLFLFCHRRIHDGGNIFSVRPPPPPLLQFSGLGFVTLGLFHYA